jgi:hypothetical protein
LRAMGVARKCADVAMGWADAIRGAHDFLSVKLRAFI